MRLGLFLSVEHALEDNVQQRLDDSYESVRTARDAGFDFVVLGQHLLVPQFQYLQSLPVLGRIAAEAGDMEIGTDVLLLPLYHPVHVAEMVATLDQICGGRFLFGVGLGYRDVEFDSVGVSRQTRLSRFLEGIDLIDKLWTRDGVTFSGEHFQVEDVTLAVKPVRKPRPPIIVAASGDKMVKRSARIADAWSAAGHGTVETLMRQTELYKEALAAKGKPFPPEYFRLSKELYVGSTREQAERESFPYIKAKYDAYSAWGQDSVLPAGETFAGSIGEISRNRFIIGSPDDCIDEISAHHEAMQFGHFSIRLHYPGMPHAQVMRALDLFAEKVLPTVQKL